jgi:hypothetical protein
MCLLTHGALCVTHRDDEAKIRFEQEEEIHHLKTENHRRIFQRLQSSSLKRKEHKNNTAN